MESLTKDGDDCVGGLAYDATEDRLYVAGITGYATPGYVQVIERATGTEIDRFVPGLAPSYVALHTRPSRTANHREALPADIALQAAYPNPFSGAATFKYVLTHPAPVRIQIFDSMGREVDRLVDKHLSAGTHEVSWDARGLAPGVYFGRLASGESKTTRSPTLMR